MSMNSEPGNIEEKPGRTEQPRPPGWLLPVKIASVVMGIMIVVGVVVLVVTIAGRIGGSGERDGASGGSVTSSAPPAPGSPSGALSDVVRTRPGAFGETTVDLPSGAEVMSVTLGADRMAIRVRMPDGSERIVVVSLVDGAHLGQVTVKSE